MNQYGRLTPEGMYHPAYEHDACGIGMVANVGGERSHDIIRMGAEVLINLTHRGAVGSDPLTGDGAGMLIQMPHTFLKGCAADLGFDLPEPGHYAAGLVFLPKTNTSGPMEIFERICHEEHMPLLGWRDMPVDESVPGKTAQATCPAMKMVFVANPGLEMMDFERKLFIVRRLTEKAVLAENVHGAEDFYVPSLSCRTLNYSGMFLANQLDRFFHDLRNEEMDSALAVVHQRYSTNTFPSWPLGQPFRYICHNGEINTLRGNINKMLAREATLSSDVWGEDLKRLFPVVVEGASDSACFDNMLEFLHLSGRTLPHAILMMIPEAWGDKYYMGHDRRGFYEYHANFMEPWDGPAGIAFTDGSLVGGILDRNGLRPARYNLTRNGLFVLASETGVLDLPPSEIAEKGRLQPGKMTIVDTVDKRVLYNDEIKAELCRQQPYRRWVAAERIEFKGGSLPGANEPIHDKETLLTRQLAFGYTQEDLDVLMVPMARDAKEPIGSMGCDTPLAVLSDKPQPLYNYFKQYFAQVTNPPIDPIREELVMSLTTFLGREGNILEERPDHAHRLKLRNPVLTNDDFARIRDKKIESFRAKTLDITWPVSEGEHGLDKAMARLCEEAEQALRDGFTNIILSDRAVSKDRVAVPSLMAVSGVGHHLIRKGIRNRAGLVLESGEPREVNHFALLSSYGCDAVNPYLAFETLSYLHEKNYFDPDLTIQQVWENYIKAIGKGILKILSKMGISTLRSYRGAQVYEAVGLQKDFVDRYFTKTTTRIGGIGSLEVARETLVRHREGYGDSRGRVPALPPGGFYTYRRDGERHLWSPEAIYFLQQATRQNRADLYERFAALINEQERAHCTLRSLFDFNFDKAKAIPVEEVEPAAEIAKRFFTGAMSFGSLSREVHESMAIAMNRLGGGSNSGEGGEDPARFLPLPNGDNRCSMVKQVASGRFGVTAEYAVNCRELQIKMAQGAKPGEGGHLPGYKVNDEIARVRNTTPGVTLISPPPHHDIYSIEDLAQLIFDLKNSNTDARISVKLVSECGVGTIAAGVSKGHADMVLISGGDGGTGASPLSSIKHAGMPWELGLSETHQTLVKNDLRDRIRVQTDGQMRTGRDVAIAALLGAEEYGFGTAALIVLGCVMMRKCHEGTCPVGVATQDERLRKRFAGDPDHLVKYCLFVAEEMRAIMAGLGIRTVDELIGRADCLKVRDGVDHWKAKGLDFSAVFYRPSVPKGKAVCRVQAQDHGIDDVLDQTLVKDCADAIESGAAVEKSYPIRNVNRTAGTILSSRIAKKYGMKGLPDDTIKLHFRGAAGQSFFAFGMQGITAVLEGDANDYIGKALSGARLVVKPDPEATFDAKGNVIIGNVALYGATCGELYARGLAGERFCVRNSGARAVVEGVGDHGCEYMTGGVAVVLGPTGVNFAAGMSGGIAFVYDPHQDFDLRCNLDMVDLDPVQGEDVAVLRETIEKHHKYTDSDVAAYMLEHWERVLPLFVKVMPMEYRRALGQMKKADLEARRTAEETVELA